MSDKSAVGWDDRYRKGEYVWTVKVNQFVERYLSALEPGTAIDLGAGEGRNAVWLASLGWDVTAVDFSQVGLDKGQRLAADHEVTVNFVLSDAVTYQPDAPVDLIVLSYLQLDNPARATILDNVVHWLNPGGTLFVIAHDKTNVTDGYGGPPTAAVCYDLDETVAAFAGMEIAVAEVAVRHVETPDGQRDALDTLVVARRPLRDAP